MKVKELVEFLKTQPQDLPVVYRCFSEQAELEVSAITTEYLGLPRSDGLVHNFREDRPSRLYLVFPGN